MKITTVTRRSFETKYRARQKKSTQHGPKYNITLHVDHMKCAKKACTHTRARYNTPLHIPNAISKESSMNQMNESLSA